jgi:hypothetical protein
MYYVPRTLFSIDTNAKTVKGQRYGVKTAVLYLAPARLAFDALGIPGTLCPLSETAGCESACLNRAGRGQFNAIQQARLNKTLYFLLDRVGFMGQLAHEIAGFVRKTLAEGFTPVVRLNGTSDNRWELEPVELDGVTYPNLMSLFPDVQFYDYTKLPNRKNLPANYDLTFSYSGVPKFRPYAEQALAAGLRVAVVFRDRASIPARFLGVEVVDGDDSDLRPYDPAGVVVALYAKGPAKKDRSGFVVDAVPAAQAAPVIWLNAA